ncbi:MAG: hypothetical protein E7018_01230 [Alphaproteobacteria bacterium]|nr:hypothetical protein [Alphaproteobacteria bacterium]
MNIDFSIFDNLARSSCSEDGVCARFYDRSIKTDRIDDAGFPVFKNVCFCEIRIKDNNSEVFDQPATEDKKRRFPQEYARYLLGKKQVSEGTPLEQFAFLSSAEIDSLKYRGVFTVEALAQLPQDKASSLGLIREKDLAQKFVSQASTNKKLADWQVEEEKYICQICHLEDELKKLQQQLKTKEPKKS